MKKITRALICFIASILFFLINTAAYASAIPENAQSKGTAPTVAENIILGVGSNESERRIAFFSDSADRSEVRVTKADNVISGMIIKDYTTFYASTIPATNASGKYAKAATITGLSENTRYAYVIDTEGYESDVYYFNTSGFGDYEFTFVGDPQLNAPSHGEEWSDTLKKIIENFDSELIISAGDQVSDPDSELHYSYLTTEEMSSIAFAPSVGPSHDSSSASFKEHYNLPNLSTKYGANSTSANYWYTYNNTLFMHLNMSDSSAATNGEHKSFMKEAMAQNPDVIWNIVVMHNSLFSTGMHGDPDYKYYESEVGKYRPALAPFFSELGIDLVLSG
ncbi:MAG: fibronectin type III domain-containing protein, partial [Clostridia bacterium]|nr:fibronectin type III domain-containing protein [Clostridia bacterium]